MGSGDDRTDSDATKSKSDGASRADPSPLEDMEAIQESRSNILGYALTGTEIGYIKDGTIPPGEDANKSEVGDNIERKIESVPARLHALFADIACFEVYLDSEETVVCEPTDAFPDLCAAYESQTPRIAGRFDAHAVPPGDPPTDPRVPPAPAFEMGYNLGNIVRFLTAVSTTDDAIPRWDWRDCVRGFIHAFADANTTTAPNDSTAVKDVLQHISDHERDRHTRRTELDMIAEQRKAQYHDPDTQTVIVDALRDNDIPNHEELVAAIREEVPEEDSTEMRNQVHHIVSNLNARKIRDSVELYKAIQHDAAVLADETKQNYQGVSSPELVFRAVVHLTGTSPTDDSIAGATNRSTHKDSIRDEVNDMPEQRSSISSEKISAVLNRLTDETRGDTWTRLNLMRTTDADNSNWALTRAGELVWYQRQNPQTLDEHFRAFYRLLVYTARDISPAERTILEERNTMPFDQAAAAKIIECVTEFQPQE